MKRHLLILGLTLAPCLASAAETIVIADNGGPPKRFYSLDKVRGEGSTLDNSLSMPITSSLNHGDAKMFALHSDANKLQNGQMRIDRLHSAIIAPTHTIASPATMEAAQPTASAQPRSVKIDPNMADTDEEEVVGNTDSVDPVLSLFDGAGKSSLSSFRDALSGGSSSISGLGAHSWPVAGGPNEKFTSGFGMRADPFNGHQAFHGGIDIAAPPGTPVLASAEGDVVQVETDSRYGKWIGIQHADGTLSRYGHLSAQNVRVGQHVKGGEPIGAVGMTGRATGPHLDYRISKGGMKFDPMAVLTMPTNMAMNTATPVTGLSGVQNGVTVTSERPTKLMRPSIVQPMVIKVR